MNARDDKGWTALMYVVDKGYVLLVEPLLQAQGQPRRPGRLTGPRPCSWRWRTATAEIIPLLMKAGADPTIKGPKGKTATEVAQARYKDQKKTFDPAMLLITVRPDLG